MLSKPILTLLTVSLISLSLLSCKKNNASIDDPHTHTIYNKTLKQIRDEIEGRWKITKECNTTIDGRSCFDQINSSLTFFPNDSIKWTKDESVFMSGKIEFNKVKASDYGDYPVEYLYLFTLPDKSISLLVYEIKNDTLEIRNPRNGLDYGNFIYLTR